MYVRNLHITPAKTFPISVNLESLFVAVIIIVVVFKIGKYQCQRIVKIKVMSVIQCYNVYQGL